MSEVKKLGVLNQVEELVTPILERENSELVDIEFKKEPVGLVLRIFIDSESGVGLDKCSRVSRIVSPILDEADVISGPYILEISSPGVERPLKKLSDFQRFVGKKAYVKTFQAIEEKRKFTGIIKSASKGKLVLSFEGKIVEIPIESICKSHLVVEIDI